MLSQRILPPLFSLALVAAPSAVRSDHDEISSLVETYLLQQIPEQAEHAKVTVNPPNLEKLPPCNQYQVFLPRGSKTIGKINVGLRCVGPANWSLFLGAQVSISSHYLSAARPLSAGQTLNQQDLLIKQGDLGQLPPGTLLDPAQALGKTVKASIPAGTPLRRDQLQAPAVIQAGQNVRVIYRAPGFSATAEGKALSNAGAGQVAQVRMPSGQIVSGQATSQGEVEINR
ncbi:flagellar basal body P-ring formation chaperone FlgA [Dechloromonas sp. ZY10]|uniref:flagellar basal body P-ring formation chaperone FlgA n=1 Tax=Dechloromonas aquae TaxID=2664436 RepID=UPI003528B13E